MHIRLPRFPTRHIWRSLFIAGLIGLVWLGWWFAPPWPEVRLTFVNRGTPGGWCLANDGQTLVFLKCDEYPSNSHNPRLCHAEVLEVPSGRLLARIEDPDGLFDPDVAPDGRHLTATTPSGQRTIYELPSGRLVTSLPPSNGNRFSWECDGRYFIYWYDDRPAIHDSHTCEVIHRFDEPTMIRFFQNGGSLISVAENENHLNVWQINPWKHIESLELPYPSSGNRKVHTSDAPRPWTIQVCKLECNFDGQFVAAAAHRFEPEGDDLAAVDCVYCWDRGSGKRIEMVEGPYFPHRWSEMTWNANGQMLFRTEAYVGSDINLPKWLRWKGLENSGPRHWRIFWDAVNNPTAARCEIAGYSQCDPKGLRIVKKEAGVVTILNGITLEPLNSIAVQTRRDIMSFEMNHQYVALSAKQTPQSWIPSWLPAFFKDVFSPGHVLIVRLKDGKEVRRIPNCDYAVLTMDGSIWTGSYSPLPSGGHDESFTLERWSPEAPWPPWWLWLSTVLGGCWVIHRWRRSPFQRLAPIAAQAGSAIILDSGGHHADP